MPLVAVVGAMVISVTCMGGPTKVVEKVKGMLEGREQLNNDSEDDRTKVIITISEVEAYQKIEDEFGFYPVRLDYLPEGIEFMDISLIDNAQSICLGYEGAKQNSIVYTIFPNYRTGSIGRDVEDEASDQYEKIVHDVTISVKKYTIEENKSNRYKASFEYRKVYYFLEINNVESQEVEKIIENLYFN